MREEHVLRVDLDLMFPADGLDVEENIIFDAYWAFDCAGLSICERRHKNRIKPTILKSDGGLGVVRRRSL